MYSFSIEFSVWRCPMVAAGRVFPDHTVAMDTTWHACLNHVRPPIDSQGTSFPSSSIGDEFNVSVISAVTNFFSCMS